MNENKLYANMVVIAFIAFTLLFLAVVPDRLSPPLLAETATPPTRSGQTAQVALTGNVVEYTLELVMGRTPPMAFVGIGGEIDNVVNPPLTANVGDTVRITIINGDPIEHDFIIDGLYVHSKHLTQKGEQDTVEFVASQPGKFTYYCSVPGHQLTGMEGTLTITGDMQVVSLETVTDAGHTDDHSAPEAGPAAVNAVSIVRAPTDLPAPIGDREPTTIDIELTTVEVTGQLADGTTYTYWTFDGAVPGPMIRVRAGDLVNITIKNDASSANLHSIDLHAVTGPGGGAVYTQTLPDGETTFSFTALNPGVYVYHCATPSVAHHIASGMYGLIVVEPEGGLPEVDREFYVMQGELYTAQPFGTEGHLAFDYEAMLDERPQYFVFNGAAGGLTSDDNALRAEVGETVRIFFGVGGPNFTSSFHVIGEIFDRAYELASVTAPPLTDVQTITVPPGGAAMVEFALEVPGRYILVDHALSRLERGLAGFLYVEGEENTDVFHGEAMTEGSGH